VDTSPQKVLKARGKYGCFRSVGLPRPYGRSPEAGRVPENFLHPRLLQGLAEESGYHKDGLQKLEAAQRIGEHVDVARSTSASFRCLAETLNEVVV